MALSNVCPTEGDESPTIIDTIAMLTAPDARLLACFDDPAMCLTALAASLPYLVRLLDAPDRIPMPSQIHTPAATTA
jgi:hypothetical protein